MIESAPEYIVVKAEAPVEADANENHSAKKEIASDAAAPKRRKGSFLSF